MQPLHKFLSWKDNLFVDFKYIVVVFAPEGQPLCRTHKTVCNE